VLERPLFFVGYSLGALLGMHFAVTHPHHKIKKWALFAPAIRSHFYALMPALLGHLLPKGKLPSLNLKNYRQRDFTTLLEYKIMHGLQKIIKTNSFSIPTLVFLNPNDELVSSAQVAFFAHQNKEWKVVEISNFESQLPRKYHHLMIDLECLGKAMWGKVLKNLTEHFLI
jgi:pimeloyl-ACP methyl ester carboxylesterase